jgi:hypothetical protein
LTRLQDPFAWTSVAVATPSYDWRFEQAPINDMTPPYPDDDGGIMRPYLDFSITAGATS